jgi:hypothetical protein
VYARRLVGPRPDDRERFRVSHTGEGAILREGLRSTVPPSYQLASQKEHVVQIKHLSSALVLVGVVSGAALAQSGDPLIGTWKLNAAKSKGTLFKSGTTVLEAAGDGIKATVDLVAVDGAVRHWGFTAKYDGKDNPVTGNNPYGDVVAITRVDSHTARIVVKNGGKMTITQTMVVSADGKTRTVTTRGADAQGKPVDSLSVYEKQ